MDLNAVIPDSTHQQPTIGIRILVKVISQCAVFAPGADQTGYSILQGKANKPKDVRMIQSGPNVNLSRKPFPHSNVVGSVRVDGSQFLDGNLFRLVGQKEPTI